MRRRSLLLFLSVAAALLASGFGGSTAPVGRDDKIGRMTGVRGIEHKADAELWGPWAVIRSFQAGALPSDVHDPHGAAAVHRLGRLGAND